MLAKDFQQAFYAGKHSLPKRKCHQVFLHACKNSPIVSYSENRFSNAIVMYVRKESVTWNDYTPANVAFTQYGETISLEKSADTFTEATFDITEADKASFTSADGTKKYTYSGYKAESSVTEDGSAELYIYYDVETVETGINQVSVSAKDNTVFYNLNGQRVDASYKGVVVKNGKKFLNK